MTTAIREAVVDANIAANVLFGQPERRERARRFFFDSQQQGVRLIAPALFAWEVDTALRLVAHRAGFPQDQIAATFAAIDALPVQLVFDEAELSALRPRSRQIAELLQQPGTYDALYAALAEARGCLFWTADERFANAARQGRRQGDGTVAPTLSCVRFIGDY